MDEVGFIDRFSANHAIARTRFLAAAAAAEAQQTSLPITAKGPGGSLLSIDIARIGTTTPRRVVLHTSGVHGVEGFPGSAIQLRILERFANGDIQLDEDVAIDLVHSVNPWGFAWLRRVNEDNADLNRNFMPPDEAHAGEPERYGDIDRFLNPARHKAFPDLFLAKALLTIARMGFNVAKQTIAEGQYTRPDSLQFGGSSLCEGPKALLKHLSTSLSDIRRCISIDVHTGLGPFGVDTLLVDAETDPETFEDLRFRYGDTVASLDPDAGVAYRIRGGMQAGFSAHFPDIDWTLITQEFGTVSPLRVIKALRAENRMTQHSGWTSERMLSSDERQRMAHTFNPPSERWRTMILERGRALLDDALDHLSD